MTISAPSQKAAYRTAVMDILEGTLSMGVPETVLDTWLRRTFAERRTPVEAAVLICQAQSQLVAEAWVEAGLRASELAEMVIADRIYECRRILERTGRDLRRVLPDLEALVNQPCFSDEFREMVANTVNWDEMIESRISSSQL